jgi:hypothetical protein
MLQYPQQTNQGRQAQGGQHGQQQTKVNKDNPAAAVVAPTTAVGEMDSTEATAMVSGITKAAA